MEEQFKRNKNKQSASEKIDSDESDSSEDSTDSNEKDSSDSSEETDSDKHTGDENPSGGPSVIVESPGTSGNVERLHE